MWDRQQKWKEGERLETEGEVREVSHIIKKEWKVHKMQNSGEGERERGWVGWTDSLISVTDHLSSPLLFIVPKNTLPQTPYRLTNPLRPSNLIGHTGRNVTPYVGLELFSFPPGAEEVEKTFREQAKQQLPQPPMFFSRFLPPVCLARPSHESDRSGVLWPLYRYKDSIEIQGERGRERERAFHSSQHPFFSPALPPFSTPSCFFFNFLLLRVGVDPPPHGLTLM